MFPGCLAFLIPGDILNNVEGVKQIYKPLLIVHDVDDSVNPYFQGEQVFKSANEPKYFERLHGFKHNDIFKASPDYWADIIRFIKEEHP